MICDNLWSRTTDIFPVNIKLSKNKSGRNHSSPDSARYLLVFRLLVMMINVDTIKVIVRP